MKHPPFVSLVAQVFDGAFWLFALDDRGEVWYQTPSDMKWTKAPDEEE